MLQAILNSRRWLHWVACVSLVCAAACSKKKPPADTTSVDQPHPPDALPGVTPLATLERTGCYGECPVYRLTVSSDGSVVYVGTRWVKVLGRQVYKLSDAQLAELQAAFERINFMSLRDFDRVENTDDDWAHLSFRRGAQVKRVRHYHGDNAAPPSLSSLEDDFDRIVESARYVGAAAATGAVSTAPSAGPASDAPAAPSSPHSAGKPSDNAGPPDDTAADPDNHP